MPVDHVVEALAPEYGRARLTDFEIPHQESRTFCVAMEEFAIVLPLMIVVLLVNGAAGRGSLDPTWESVSGVYPLLAHSREALGVPDHPVAAALDIAKENDPLCTLVYPLESPTCSPLLGSCNTGTSGLGQGMFTLFVTMPGLPGNATVGINCSHSSTRSLGETCYAVDALSLPACMRARTL